MAGGEPTEVILDDFFFYDPKGIMEWAAAYYQSGFNPGHLPRPVGGMKAQHWTVKHDWQIFNRGIAWAQYEMMPKKKDDF